MKKVLATLVIAPLLGFALWTFAAVKYVYAQGERAGFVQKFSKKGWIIKTWEGELAMVNLPGAMPEIFNFTVRDDAVAREIERLIGQRVALHYEHHRGLPGRLFGDTSHFVTRVATVASRSAAATPSAPAQGTLPPAAPVPPR